MMRRIHAISFATALLIHFSAFASVADEPAPAPAPAEPIPPPPPASALPLPPPPPPPPPQAQPQGFDQPLPFIVEPEEQKQEPPKPTIPLQRRGFIGVDAAVATIFDDRAALVADLVASIPLTKRAFFDARLPSLLSERRNVVGAPLIGGRYLAHPTKLLWLDVGGALGLPVATGGDATSPWYRLARGGWDMQTFFPDSFLMKAHLDFEIATDPVLLRLALAPLITLDLGGNGSGNGVHLQQAFEIQSRGPVGGGFRLQGVFSPSTRSNGDSAFLLAPEPFFYVEKKVAFMRLGLMLPFEIGQSSSQNQRGLNYSLRISTGIRLD